jgi:hypothetical protein
LAAYLPEVNFCWSETANETAGLRYNFACTSGKYVVVNYLRASTWIQVIVQVAWAIQHARSRWDELSQRELVNIRSTGFAFTKQTNHLRAGSAGWSRNAHRKVLSASLPEAAERVAHRSISTNSARSSTPGHKWRTDEVYTYLCSATAGSVRSTCRYHPASREFNGQAINPLATNSGNLEGKVIVCPRSVGCWTGIAEGKVDLSMRNCSCTQKQHSSKEAFKRSDNSSFHEKDYDLSV